MSIINQNDLIALNKFYHIQKSSLHFVYGASYSGKTTLIRDFMVKKNILYIPFTSMLPNLLFSNITTLISKKFNIKISLSSYKSFEDILELLVELVLEDKVTIVFDNFHELLKIDKNALEIFIKIWNKKLKKLNIQLIILSSIKFDDKIAKKIQQIESFSFEIDKVSFSDILHKSDNKIFDKIYIHSCFGSSNYVLSAYDRKIDFIKNLHNIALNPNSKYFNFGIDYLKIYFSDITTYASILYAISIGNNKVGDIANVLNLSSTYLSRYINKLQLAMIIKKELPINDKFKFSKQGRYYIQNDFLKFWFCYIYQNKGYLEIKKYQPIVKKIDETIVNRLIIPVYKGLIINLLKDNSKDYLGFDIDNIGSWWDNNGNNIDIIAYNDKQITFIKVLWENRDITNERYKELQLVSNSYKTNLKKNYIIITKNTYLNNFK